MLIVSKVAEVEADHDGTVAISTYVGKIIDDVRESDFCGEIRSIFHIGRERSWGS